MADDTRHAFGDDGLRVEVAAYGAELQSLVDPRFGELMWGRGPEWARSSPVLFPIVGRLNGDALRVGGQTYPLGKHGFARNLPFQWLERGASGCRLELHDSAETREAYPFPFRLELAYAVAEGALTVRYRLENTGNDVMPASLGAHPAFRWPLTPGVAADAHRIAFERDEPDPIRRLNDGLIDAQPRETPVRSRTLVLERGLFAEDAVILDRLHSRSLRYVAPGALALEIAWEGFSELGIWTKADAGDFLCIEPWKGFADPVGYAGEFADKPGVFHLQPGETREFAWSVRPVAEG